MRGRAQPVQKLSKVTPFFVGDQHALILHRRDLLRAGEVPRQSSSLSPLVGRWLLAIPTLRVSRSGGTRLPGPLPPGGLLATQLEGAVGDGAERLLAVADSRFPRSRVSKTPADQVPVTRSLVPELRSVTMAHRLHFLLASSRRTASRASRSKPCQRSALPSRARRARTKGSPACQHRAIIPPQFDIKGCRGSICASSIVARTSRICSAGSISAAC